MKLLAILPQDSVQTTSAFTKEFLYAIGALPDTAIIDISHSKTVETDHQNAILTIETQEKSSVGNWFANRLRYQPIIKRFSIEKILLAGSLTHIESAIPQILVLPSTMTLSAKEKLFIQKYSFTLITYSEKKKAEWQSLFPKKEVFVFIPGVSDLYKPLSWDNSLVTKEKYSDGEEYFLVEAHQISIETCVRILKGFSIFKKWQKSNMKIVFLLEDILALQEKVANYKYRDDVRMINNPDENDRAALIASAYCNIHVPEEDSNNIFAFQSVKCGIPLLLRQASTMASWLIDNAFLISDEKEESMGQAIITMYKAENLRSNFMDYYEKFALPVSDMDIQTVLF